MIAGIGLAHFVTMPQPTCTCSWVTHN